MPIFTGTWEKLKRSSVRLSKPRGPECNIGDVCRIFRKGSDEFIYGEAVGFNEGKVVLMPYTDIDGIGFDS